MLKKEQKNTIIEELTAKFNRQKTVVFSDFHGISVNKLQQLRRLLKKDQAEYKVAKKTLLDRALEKSGISLKTKELQGEVGVVFNYGENITLLIKNLIKFAKENETFKILGGILGTRILNSKDIALLAKLPPREILLTQLLRELQSSIRNLAIVLCGNVRNLIILLKKIQQNKQA